MNPEEAKLLTQSEPAESGLDMYLEAMQLENRMAETRPSLSTLMKQRGIAVGFFVNYAARKGIGFDRLCWNYIDMRFFGENRDGGHEGRLSLLSDDQHEQMELSVRGCPEKSRGW